ncbi:hypothetical protein BZA05DRAFT_403295 [Tricharina praecox]|uniref:uncharacterized protein n=1 Tax=Tricharina praecox TaxID=43433 RepID=UPI0022200248|nr:uncharacterized protein BZA05DRAFT_403295 [Tricharina praecox]KAI5848960.1 hypothetical protein BZA05DRAFT_403295 [Tricharina praecox]
MVVVGVGWGCLLACLLGLRCLPETSMLSALYERRFMAFEASNSDRLLIVWPLHRHGNSGVGGGHVPTLPSLPATRTQPTDTDSSLRVLYVHTGGVPVQSAIYQYPRPVWWLRV